MANSKKLIEYIGSEANVSVPTAVNDTLVRAVATSAFQSSINTVMMDMYANDIPGAPWGAENVVWLKEPKCSIDFNANGGSGSMPTRLANIGIGYKIPQCEFIGAQSTSFNTWAVDSVSGETVSPGTQYAFSRATTLYALWNQPERWLDNIKLTSQEAIDEGWSGGFSYGNVLSFTKPIDSTSTYNIPKTIAGTTISYVHLQSTSFTAIGGKGVTELPQRAFFYCRSLTEVSFPESSTIFDDAFAYCVQLSSAYIPKAEYISRAAFEECYCLLKADFPLCSQIEGNAFMQCSSLSIINLPLCTKLSWRVFESCYQLKSVNIPKCEFIGSTTFAGCSYIESMYLPECSEIYKDAFSRCFRLSSIYAPKCTRFEGFYNCSGLSYVSQSLAKIAEVGRCQNVSYIYLPQCSQGQFVGNTNLTSIVLSSYVPVLSQYAFCECYKLPSVSVPGCSFVGSYAFSRCSSLTSISLPECSYIGWDAFNGCIQLSNIYIPNCEYIGGRVFNRTPWLSSKFSNGVATFTNNKHKFILACSSNQCPSTIIDDDVTYVGIDAFQLCASLTTVSFPNCRYVGDYAFYYCEQLTSISFPQCSFIGADAFVCCSSLQYASLPNLDYVNAYTFGYCRSLSEVYLPNCSRVGYYGFTSCDILSSINLPKCGFIGSTAFCECTNLSAICLPSTSMTTLYATDAFRACNNLSGIFVPKELVDVYKSATNWSYYASLIKPLIIPINCKSLTITGEDCTGRAKTTTVHASTICDMQDMVTSEIIENQQLNFDDISEEFPQNPSTTETVQRTVSYTYFDKTATCTVTQGVWVPKSYSVENVGTYGFAIDSSIPNPDSTLYEGVYKSSNQGIDSTCSVAKITFIGYEAFNVYIRSYAESRYDYTIASTLDADTFPQSTSSSTTKAHTSNNQQAGTSLGSYTKVTYNTDCNEHFIYIVYRKDSSSYSGTDSGYFLIEK